MTLGDQIVSILTSEPGCPPIRLAARTGKTPVHVSNELQVLKRRGRVFHAARGVWKATGLERRPRKPHKPHNDRFREMLAARDEMIAHLAERVAALEAQAASATVVAQPKPGFVARLFGANGHAV